MLNVNKIQKIAILAAVIFSFLGISEILSSGLDTPKVIFGVSFILFNLITNFFFFLKFNENINKHLYIISFVYIISVSLLIFYSADLGQRYSLLYILIIFFTGYFLGFNPSLIITNIILFFYLGVLLINYYNIFPLNFGEFNFSLYEIFMLLLFNCVIYYLICFAAGFVWEEIKESQFEKEILSEKYKRLQNDTNEIINNIPSGIIVTDDVGKIVFFNSTGKNILNVDPNLIVENKFINDILNDSYNEIKEIILKSFNNKSKIERMEIEIKEKNKIIGLSNSWIKENDDYLGSIYVFQDLTKIRELEKRLIEIDKIHLINQVSANIAHEIRNPLAAVSGAVETLYESIQNNQNCDSEENSILLELILKETKRINNIITNFLSYAKEQNLILKPINIKEIIIEVIKMLKNTKDYQNKTIEFLINVDENFILNVDAEAFKQILYNLLLNSIQAIGDYKGTIEIISNESANSKILIIRDNGIGISEKDKNNLFIPFKTSKKNGTGLGLSIVKKIMLLHNAEITINNIKENNMSGVEVKLIFRKE